MANMSVAYQRPNYSLQTLVKEVYALYGYTPRRASEYVTGYKDPNNFTGHNADNRGVVHAVDIFTDENGNLPEAEGRALAEKLRQIGAATGRFNYLIHDMSPGAPAPKIAGAFNNWQWEDYTGSSPHSDHIHISTVDLYWGDPVNFPASVYDSTATWGLAKINPSGGGVTPLPEKDWFDNMDENTLRKIIREETPKVIWGMSGKRPSEKGGQTMWNRVVVANEQAVRAAANSAAALELAKQAAAKQGLDVSKIDSIVTEAVKKGLADGTVDVNVTVAGGTNG